MFQHSDTIVNTYGSPVQGASVTVNTAAGTPATIYSDNGITQAANPLTSNAAGAFSFYAAGGSYVMVISGMGFTQLTIPIALGGTTGNFSDQEIPGGAVNGSNKVFALANTPNPSTSLGGMLRPGGKGAFLPLNQPIDFTVSGNLVTMTNAPAANSNLAFSYRY
ncbi:MAG TPA: carboxypeptidase-like regulatory domain-containing protein [Burkholderiaceae bacterium]